MGEYDLFWKMWESHHGRASYTIELAVQKISSAEFRCVLTLWHAARYKWMGGAADEKMFICGYDDCEAPIDADDVSNSLARKDLKQILEKDSAAALEHLKRAGHLAICRECKRPLISSAFTSRIEKRESSVVQRSKTVTIKDPASGKSYPLLKDALLLIGSPEFISERVAIYWDLLKGDADIYLKWLALSIGELKKEGFYDEDKRPLMHNRDELIVYPAKKLAEDASAGSSIAKRIEVFLKA